MKYNENTDEVGVRINESEFPLLNLFKILNGGILLVVLVFVGYANSIIIKLLLISSLVLGFTSLFIPAKRKEIRNFSVLSVCLYIGLLVFYLGN